jgi:hypothetical protein
MADWGKLDKEFYDKMDSLSQEDWDRWKSSRAAKKLTRRIVMQREIKIHLNNLKRKENEKR